MINYSEPLGGWRWIDILVPGSPGNSVGCDSTAILHLTINNSSSSTEDIISCDSFDWNGTTYTESGTYTYYTTNSVGCDSIVTLNLTINNSSSSSEDVTACETYEWNGEIYTESGIYTFYTTNIYGCDSTATLNLTINNSASSSEISKLVGVYVERPSIF